MGAVCAGGTMKPKSEVREKNSGFSGKLKSIRSFSKQKEDHRFSYPDVEVYEKNPQNYDSGELRFTISRELKPSTPARLEQNKVPQTSSFLGRAGIVGLERAVDVLDTLGSSMSNLNSHGGFISGMGSRGNRISILAFEIANTIAKGGNLMQSLSQENVQFLKKEVLISEGVQQLVSTDMKELLSIAAADKREECEVFSREVIRFGDLCKDPQWHYLGRFFSKLDSEHAFPKQQREDAETTMQELTTLAQHTSELYHELNTLDRFDQEYRCKLKEVESLHLPRKGESVMILHSELKHQRKLVRSLKKKSLWAKSLEEVVEKLVDIVTFIHQEILESFGDNGLVLVGEGHANKKPERLGVAGLALHYANIINQIDNIASRPTSLPPNMRDQLYHGLPNSVKLALRSRCQTETKEELTIPQIKNEMEKTLQWLVPVATNTSKAHQGFGWVGEWANSGNEFSKKGDTCNSVIRLQTLYHADKQKTDQYILELATWLHLLISAVRQRDNGIRVFPTRSPTRKGLTMQPKSNHRRTHSNVKLSPEDRKLLEKVLSRKKLAPGLSKSQEFALVKKRGSKVWALSRSTGNSPNRQLQHPKFCDLDVLDGLDTTF
ncbi:GATA zinc finger domain-containing protein [Actinidia chinensis var. chinensis]|uniref:GATA zinc finger domain-containing protein n=1 Tax=Actinidia chinensis var. chinensis TaxID=1590841 RepID=A0A2R6PZJ7_ACTCC|nr:GATA zinc finger domain-containing protein [Actinidia chinensis var. chinensis]